ncbi:MAG: lipase maturation factor family protein [Candidatus Acidiferrales bacterium]
MAVVNWLFGPEPISAERPGHLWPRWIFLRALGLIYCSAFYSLLFQIKGLNGPNGILPAGDYLQAVTGVLHGQRFWLVPSLFWFGSGNHALMLVCWLGLVASLLLVLNIWPRGMLAVCFACFVSFVSTAQDFSSYQSDGMLLEAGFISLFFAPPGFRPGLARENPASRASCFLLLWEWFRIYFESGVVKIVSGDISWRQFTAMDDYYQNGPLPSWIGWYVQQFPHRFHAGTVLFTFVAELVLCWLVFLPRRFRIAAFCILTPFQIGIILTANYAFLNYIVLSLGFLLLDDRVIEAVFPARWRGLIDNTDTESDSGAAGAEGWRMRWRTALKPFRIWGVALCLGAVFYVTSLLLAEMLFRPLPLPQWPARMLDPFRIANQYGLFAVMTHARYEIEFQGSRDGKTWTAYPFRYKPQDLRKPPGIYAPYQPRFDWNLWFASLGPWQSYRFVVWTEERLLQNQPDVLELFAGNPFDATPPRQVRAIIYQYWFTDRKTKRETGMWWRREPLGEYAPPLAREPDGKVVILNTAIASPPPP